MKTKIFYSFVIPARNEGDYIEDTLKSLLQLKYDSEYFEIIVVVNGSSDTTLDIVKKYASKHPHISFFQSELGVSKAKNKGKENINHNSKWVIFLDADTIVKPNFLKEFSIFVENSKDNITIGTSEVLPYKNDSLRAKLWFKFYDWGHKYTHTSYSIQICRADIARKIYYDEQLCLSEDLQFIRDAETYGKFFFFPTKTVLTSTRRFQYNGYWRLFFFWIFFGIMPYFIKKQIDYEVVR